MRAFAVSLMLVVASASPGRAAKGDKVVVTSFAVTGAGVTDEVRAQYLTSLKGGLAAAGFEVLPEDEVAQKLAARPGLTGCDTALCRIGIGEATGARFTVSGELSAAGSNYRSHLQIASTKDGKVAATVEDNCAVCTAQEARDSISLGAAALYAKLAALEAPPPAAVVAAQARPAPRVSPWVYRGLGLGLGAGGLAALAVGFVEWHRDDSLACTPPAGGTCATRHDTTGGQALSFSLAGASLVTAAVLSYVGWKRPRVQVAPAASAGTAGLSVRGSF